MYHYFSVIFMTSLQMYNAAFQDWGAASGDEADKDEHWHPSRKDLTT